MSGPLIFVSHSTVKDGKAEVYAKHIRRGAELVEAEEPRMIGFLCYASEDGTEVSTVQVHPDADSLDTHMRVFTENLQSLALESLDTTEVNVYGEPSETTRGVVAQHASMVPGLRVREQPVHQAGFLRPQPM